MPNQAFRIPKEGNTDFDTQASQPDKKHVRLAHPSHGLVPHDVELAAVQAFIDTAVLGHSVRISLHWRLHKSVVGKHSVVAILTALSVHQGQPVWGVHVMHAVCTAIFWEGNGECSKKWS